MRQHAKSCTLMRRGTECTCYLRAQWIQEQAEQTFVWQPQKDSNGRALLYCCYCLALQKADVEPNQAVAIVEGASLCLKHFDVNMAKATRAVRRA